MVARHHITERMQRQPEEFDTEIRQHHHYRKADAHEYHAEPVCAEGIGNPVRQSTKVLPTVAECPGSKVAGIGTELVIEMQLYPESDEHTENSGDNNRKEHPALVDIGKLGDLKRLQLVPASAGVGNLD